MNQSCERIGTFESVPFTLETEDSSRQHCIHEFFGSKFEMKTNNRAPVRASTPPAPLVTANRNPQPATLFLHTYYNQGENHQLTETNNYT